MIVKTVLLLFKISSQKRMCLTTGIERYQLYCEYIYFNQFSLLYMNHNCLKMLSSHSILKATETLIVMWIFQFWDIQVGRNKVGLYNFRRSNFSNKSHRGIKMKQKSNVSKFTLMYSAKRAKFSPEYHVYKNHDISSDNSTAKVNNNASWK